MPCLYFIYIYICNTQGAHATLETWKVLELKKKKIKAWNVLELFKLAWRVLEF
jgi:hypothetical protein